MSKAQVDFFADVSCPWCYVGWEALKRAAEARPEVKLSVAWRTFLLQPDMPADGYDRKEYFKERFGENSERFAASRIALEKLAGEAQAPINLDAATRVPSTLNAHRLIHWAANDGAAEGVIDMIFAAYFVHGRDIGDVETLVDVAGKCGLKGDHIRVLLAGNTDRELVLSLHVAAAKVGITGVPVAVFNRKSALVGAQSPSVYGQALDGTLSTTAH
ncbi:MAG: DsbA family oxidoreductase [Hyphomonadaceae bacterium]|nr:DsbA family oxidoreductase [Hyphomonadaceae bacterium]